MKYITNISNYSILKDVATISKVYILYNPVSTNNSEALAQKMYDRLKDMPFAVQLLQTKYAGHAAEFASTHANEPETMILSASGDGTYHEVIDAVLKNSTLESRAITGVLPAGNANDHYHFVHSGDTVNRIKRGDVRRIDTLEISYGDERHYAHSYAGLGVTSQIGHELNQTKLNRLKETWFVLKNFVMTRGVKLSIAGKKQRFGSLVFSTSGRMAKFVTLSDTAKVDDGVFEITAIRETHWTKLLEFLMRAIAIGAPTPPTAERFEFRTLKKTPMQLDGEIIELPANTDVTVKSAHKSLRCIV